MSVFVKSASVVYRRAAFDVGSGSTKLVVAEINVSEKSVISKVVFGEERPCAYGSDWLRSSSGSLSPSIINKGRDTFSILKGIAEELGATSYSAIATEVFRKAANGQEYIEALSAEMKMPIRIVSQEIEAELGYATGVALSPFRKESQYNCLVWDSGGASFQITYRDSGIPSSESPLQHYIGAFGSGISMKILIETVRGLSLSDVSSPNPVSARDVEALVTKLLELLPREVPSWLRNAEMVTAIGGPNSVFYLANRIVTDSHEGNPSPATSPSVASVESPVACFESSFSEDDIRQALTKCVEQHDEQLKRFITHPHPDPPALIVPKLALLLAVMTHTGVQRVMFVEAIGSCAGLLTSEEYWQ